MAATRFDFANTAGDRLSGVLETGESPRAYALFAHCFTCDKTSLAATRLTRALAGHGIGVLRFDFTGLGASEGDFGRGLSGDVADLVAAAEAMTAAGRAPQLLIGHSFGGAAVLAAAGSLPGVKAVATIAAPFDAEHVLDQLAPAALDAIAGTGGGAGDGVGDGRVPVSIGGRPFELGRAFVDDVRAARQDERIATLRRALLVLHSPVDEIVGVDNASRIFLTAKHPKSFVSLDHADHLLRRKADSDYAATVIAAWASRYLELEVVADAPPAHGVRVEETGVGRFEVRAVTAAGHALLIDEPRSVGGGDAGPTPYDLLGAALGACTAMTCRLYAARKEWPLDRVTVEVGHTGRTATARDRFVRRIGFTGKLDDDQTARLLEIAERCPVHRTLVAGADVVTEPLGGDGALSDVPDDHCQQMDATCGD